MSLNNTFSSLSARAYGFQSQNVYFSEVNSINSTFAGFGGSLSLSEDKTTLFVGHTPGAGVNSYSTFSIITPENIVGGSTTTGNFRYNDLGCDGAYNSTGNALVVGASLAFGPTGNTSYGAAWIIDSSGTTIVQASDKANNDQFGYSVDISSNGERVIIGAPLGNAAYVFNKISSVWTESQILSGSGLFGYEVAYNKSNDDIFIGASTANSSAGQVFYYAYANGSYTLSQTISNPIGNTTQFGQTIKTKDKYLLIGGDGDNVNLYEKVGNTYSLQSTINNSANSFGDDGGADLNSTGQIISVGAWFDTDSFIYNGQPTSYVQTQTINKANGQFGISMAMSNDGTLLFIGADTTPGTPTGKVFVYKS